MMIMSVLFSSRKRNADCLGEADALSLAETIATRTASLATLKLTMTTMSLVAWVASWRGLPLSLLQPRFRSAVRWRRWKRTCIACPRISQSFLLFQSRWPCEMRSVRAA